MQHLWSEGCGKVLTEVTIPFAWLYTIAPGELEFKDYESKSKLDGVFVADVFRAHLPGLYGHGRS